MTKTALILIDWQQAFENHDHWGGNRNNPDAEKNGAKLLHYWRDREFFVVHCTHDSTDIASPLRLDRPGGKIIDAFKPLSNEPVLVKNTNSAFINTELETMLRDNTINDLVICGLTTNHCVSTTTRMAGNLGFNVTLAGDACATFDRYGPDGTLYKADIVHDISLANIHKEFCEVKRTADIIDEIAHA